MTLEEFTDLKTRLQPDDASIRRVEIAEEELAMLTREQAEELVATLGSHALMMLPKKERDFFTWLKLEDPAIWEDLWGGEAEPYLVSLGYLPDLAPNRRGFLICDLVDNENFVFTADDLTDEGRIFFDAALEIVKDNGKLTLAQAFVVEIWRAPIDQWRFAYMYNIPLTGVKELVQWLLAEELIARPQPEEEDVISEQGEE